MRKTKTKMSIILTRRNDGKFSCELLVREDPKIYIKSVI